MANSIPQQSASAQSISQQIDTQVDLIDQLLTNKMKEAVGDALVEIWNLLILYILSAGDKDAQKDINKEAGQVVGSLSKASQAAHKTEEDLNALKNNPADLTQETLDFLNSLVKQLEHS